MKNPGKGGKEPTKWDVGKNVGDEVDEVIVVDDDDESFEIEFDEELIAF